MGANHRIQMCLLFLGVPEDHPKKSRHFSVPKAVPLTARMETSTVSVDQTGSQPQQIEKQGLAPVTEDEGTEEGTSTGRFVIYCNLQ